MSYPKKPLNDAFKELREKHGFKAVQGSLNVNDMDGVKYVTSNSTSGQSWTKNGVTYIHFNPDMPNEANIIHEVLKKYVDVKWQGDMSYAMRVEFNAFKPYPTEVRVYVVNIAECDNKFVPHCDNEEFIAEAERQEKISSYSRVYTLDSFQSAFNDEKINSSRDYIRFIEVKVVLKTS